MRLDWMGLTVLTVLLLLPGWALALPEDQGKPINLKADSASFDQRSGRSEYRGNVVLTQGSMRLDADVATVFLDAGTFQKMEATGKPARFTYQPQANRPPINGSGRKIVYDALAQKLVVSGGARLLQGGDEFTGKRIEYDLSKDVVKGQGITMQFQPRQSQP